MKNKPFHRRFRFALAGLYGTLRTERSFRTQTLAAGLVGVALLWRRPAPLWWALMALAIAIVLASELFNTAIEHLADHLHPEQHPGIRVVKDCAAAAVLLASLGALGVALAFVWTQLF